MNRSLVRALSIALAVGLLAVFAAACGSSDDAPAGAKKMTFKLTDAGCTPHDAKAPAGPINFEVENDGTSKVTEMEIMDGETILGEKENLSDGLSGSFALTLEKGEYVIYCPGGDDDTGTLIVSGELKADDSPEVEAAVDQYREYIEKNTDELVAETKPFVAAVVAGNVAKAKSLYPAARIPYERIEPVAESFGDLDPRIDARENDVPKSEWSGFHVIEKALWEDNTAKGMAPVAAAARKRRRRAGQESRNRRPAGGPDRQRRQRAPRRGLGLEDHRRGGALLAHRPGRLQGQRRRVRGGLRSGRAAAEQEGPEAGQGNRSRLHQGLRDAEALRNRRWLRQLRRPDQGRHPQAGPVDRHAGREAVAGSGGRSSAANRLDGGALPPMSSK